MRAQKRDTHIGLAPQLQQLEWPDRFGGHVAQLAESILYAIDVYDINCFCDHTNHLTIPPSSTPHPHSCLDCYKFTNVDQPPLFYCHRHIIPYIVLTVAHNCCLRVHIDSNNHTAIMCGQAGTLLMCIVCKAFGINCMYSLTCGRLSVLKWHFLIQSLIAILPRVFAFDAGTCCMLYTRARSAKILFLYQQHWQRRRRQQKSGPNQTFYICWFVKFAVRIYSNI